MGDDIEVIIDLEEIKEINTIKTRFYSANGQWIYAPKKIDLAYSLDGEKYHLLKELEPFSTEHIAEIKAEFKPVNAKYLKIFATNYGIIPEGKQGAGNKAWTFIDEIIIE